MPGGGFRGFPPPSWCGDVGGLPPTPFLMGITLDTVPTKWYLRKPN